MPKYTVTWEREWCERETYEEVIEAENDTEAAAKAANLAKEFDEDCPDDTVVCKDGYAGDWSVDSVESND
jgi:hypothetical protein